MTLARTPFPTIARMELIHPGSAASGLRIARESNPPFQDLIAATFPRGSPQILSEQQDMGQMDTGNTHTLGHLDTCVQRTRAHAQFSEALLLDKHAAIRSTPTGSPQSQCTDTSGHVASTPGQVKGSCSDLAPWSCSAGPSPSRSRWSQRPTSQLGLPGPFRPPPSGAHCPLAGPGPSSSPGSSG